MWIIATFSQYSFVKTHCVGVGIGVKIILYCYAIKGECLPIRRKAFIILFLLACFLNQDTTSCTRCKARNANHNHQP